MPDEQDDLRKREQLAEVMAGGSEASAKKTAWPLLLKGFLAGGAGAALVEALRATLPTTKGSGSLARLNEGLMQPTRVDDIELQNLHVPMPPDDMLPSLPDMQQGLPPRKIPSREGDIHLPGGATRLERPNPRRPNPILLLRHGMDTLSRLLAAQGGGKLPGTGPGQ